jgi:G3E family GTPase
MDGDLELEKLEIWLQLLLSMQGQDIFRPNGILSVRDRLERLIFQGVHMVLEARFARPWGNQPRHNRLVFIGRNLNRDFLQQGFELCLADSESLSPGQ